MKDLFGYEGGVIIESIAPVSTKIWQVFPLVLILVSPWLFKGITIVIVSGKFLRVQSIVGGSMWEPSFRSRYRAFKKDLHMTFKNSLFFSVPSN